jgi:tRNA U34 5-methylaminomethyl-2-thiouridine-forming methyltransferase MnmC
MKKLVTVLCCGALLIAGCSLSKAPAQAAITAAEEALNLVRAEAQQFVPDQLAMLETALGNAKNSFTKGDYNAAIAAAKDIPLKIKDLTAAIEAKKAELPKVWEALAKDVPKLIASTKAAVAKAKGVDPAMLDQAKASLDEMPATWTKAQAAFKDGNLAEAVGRATEITDQCAKIAADIAPKTAGK